MSSTGCCGVKKQKLSGLSSSSSSSSSSASQGICCPTGGSTSTFHRSNRHRSGGEEAMDEEELAGKGLSRGPRNKVVCPEMIVFCFEILEHFLNGTESPHSPEFPNDQFPLFVTWKMGSERKLRGCIGTFNCTSLHHGLREYAITSACKDSRFSPITSDELSRLHCSVSLLMDFEVADHYLDWEIGIHGIRIEFTTEKGAKKAATYLPEVAVEQGWNQIQTIDSLLRKGGFRGSITPDIRASVCIVRFQSDKLSVSFAEYVAHKQKRGSNGFTPSSNGYSSHHFSPDTSAPSHSRRNHRLFPSLGGGRDHRHSSSRTSSGGGSSSKHSPHQTKDQPHSTASSPNNSSSSVSAREGSNTSSSSSSSSNNHHHPHPSPRYLPLLNQPYPHPPHQSNH